MQTEGDKNGQENHKDDRESGLLTKEGDQDYNFIELSKYSVYFIILAFRFLQWKEAEPYARFFVLPFLLPAGVNAKIQRGGVFKMKKMLPSGRDDFFPNLFGSGFETDLFDRFFKENNYPKVDIKDMGDRYELDMDVPGFSKEDVKVEYRDGYLEVEGKHEEKKETKEEDGHYIRKERSYGSFKRSFYVGDIDENSISGSFKDGMLMLQVPKANEEKTEKVKRIELQ